MPEDPEILQAEMANFLAEHNVIIREGSIEAIRNALNDNLEVAEIAAISYEEIEEDFVLSLPRDRWVDYLNATLESLSAQDEFEICVKIQKLIEEIKA
jgi:hypothetical protein